MPSYMISYDKNQGDDYTPLIDAIKAYKTYWRHLESTCIIVTSSTSQEITDNLSKHLDNNDKLIVVELTGEGAWTGFNDSARRWLLNNL